MIRKRDKEGREREKGKGEEGLKGAGYRGGCGK